GYAVRDIVWLRIFVLLGGATEIVYGFKIAERPLWVTITWASLGLGLNAVQLLIVIKERRPLRLTPGEQELLRTTFRAFAPGQFLKVMRVGTWRDAETGTILTREGEMTDSLALIFCGIAGVDRAGRRIATVEGGKFIGEMSFLTGGPASATVTVL